MKVFCKFFFTVCIATIIVSCSSEDDSINSNINTDELTNETNISDDILALVNQHRQSLGLSTLSKNNTAEQLAIDHTKYMISIEEINHDNFNQRGNILGDEENATGTAENVARFYSDAQSVVDGWLNSTGHRENIEGNYMYTGISAIKDENGRYYYTQLFYR
ncbi:CAP domain-containing protein [Aquimarina sp. MMG015]|uniref:CAP domain-containing protein n=1 Tax=Aquimarina TaxID=290174 RepID=UPI0004235D02|nr:MULTISPECIES: CAP domain-containing protein [Aquimarina]AXT58301.1 CAP domain-containing protein [Aquimarina sp. AD1]MBQ4804869.1 CAP domain-containing protein [Aquimarina sp. MMG015]RKN02522.1 CAP domain-containing protein [Aquimarina sp. AD1]